MTEGDAVWFPGRGSKADSASTWLSLLRCQPLEASHHVGRKPKHMEKPLLGVPAHRPKQVPSQQHQLPDSPVKEPVDDYSVHPPTRPSQGPRHGGMDRDQAGVLWICDPQKPWAILNNNNNFPTLQGLKHPRRNINCCTAVDDLYREVYRHCTYWFLNQNFKASNASSTGQRGIQREGSAEPDHCPSHQPPNMPITLLSDIPKRSSLTLSNFFY